MDPYDSDSSVDEDFTDTGVLLGYSTEEVIEDIVSHLGGLPVWLIHGHPTTTTSPLIKYLYSRHGSTRTLLHQETLPTAKSATVP